jgi:hypothetical protein
MTAFGKDSGSLVRSPYGKFRWLIPPGNRLEVQEEISGQ